MPCICSYIPSRCVYIKLTVNAFFLRVNLAEHWPATKYIQTLPYGNLQQEPMDPARFQDLIAVRQRTWIQAHRPSERSGRGRVLICIIVNPQKKGIDRNPYIDRPLWDVMEKYVRKCDVCNNDFESDHPTGAWQGNNTCDSCSHELAMLEMERQDHAESCWGGNDPHY